MKPVSNPVLRRLAQVAGMPDLPGGRYTLQELLGSGGMGEVHASHDEALDREVAIKVVHARGDRGMAERLRREARVLARLEHPGIVPVHDVGLLSDGRIFYVMKRVRGETLAVGLKRLTDLDRRLGVFERICETVAFAHEHGVVHRDLKPDNIMVGAFGEVLVMDWGVAKVLDEPLTRESSAAPPAPSGQTDSGTVLGTPGFMAPEQARGEAVDRRADVYALGAILFQMLFDRPPAADGSDAETVRSSRGLPRRMRAICRMALEPSPGERYSDASGLADDIARYRSGRPVRAYREHVFDRLERILTTHRTAILLILAYLIVRGLISFLGPSR